jgi:hypothetical protein
MVLLNHEIQHEHIHLILDFGPLNSAAILLLLVDRNNFLFFQNCIGLKSTSSESSIASKFIDPKISARFLLTTLNLSFLLLIFY